MPGMESGGFLWFENLIWPDPYFVLPLATGLLQHLAIRVSNLPITVIGTFSEEVLLIYFLSTAWR